MTINQLLLWLTWISVLLFVGRVLNDSQRQRGWLLAVGGVVLVSGASVVVALPIAGWLSFGAWLLLLVTPTVAAQQSSAALQSERLGRAAVWSWLAALLHPFDDWPQRARVWSIVAAGDRVGTEATIRALERDRTMGSIVGRLAVGLTYAIAADWAGLLAWLKFHTKHKDSFASNPNPKRNKPATDTEQDIHLIMLYLQALGETGQLDRLVSECDRLSHRLESSAIRPRTYRTWLFVFAYSGDRDAVETFIASCLLNLSPGARDRWRAIARVRQSVDRPPLSLVADRPLRLRVLDRLRRSVHALFGLTLSRDPSRPTSINNFAPTPIAPSAAPPSPETRDRLETFKRRFLEEVRYGFHRPLYFPLITSIAIVLNLLVFSLELSLGGSQNAFVLYALGAVVPAAVLESGQTWRLLAGTFLHFGWLHLATNMAGLFLLGQLAERWLGTLRYSLVYLASGVGSMGLVVMTVALGLEDDLRFVVGASGAVMGVFGAIAAVLWRGYRRDRAVTAQQNLRTVGLLFVLQSGFDVLNPQICATCHLSGAAIGFVVAWLFAPIGLRLRVPPS